MSSNTGGVFLYDSADKPNAPVVGAAPRQAQARIDFRVILAVIVGCVVLFCFLVVLHVVAWGMYVDEPYRPLGGFLLALIYGFATLVLMGGASLMLYLGYTKIQRNTLINVLEHQTTMQGLKNLALTDSYMTVANTRAQQSMFAGVQNLTYSPSKHIEGQAPLMENLHSVSLEQEQEQDYPSTIVEMERAGLINRSGNSLLVGFSSKTQEGKGVGAQYIELEQLGVLALVGVSGSGKTSTIRFLLTQLLLLQANIFVCDPHGQTRRENLTKSIEPLLPFLKLAISHEERFLAIQAFGTILAKRLEGTDSSTTPIVLILDEAPAHFLQCSAEELKETARIFQSTANEGRKVGVHAILLLQNVKHDFIGSRSIRSSLTHMIFHRTNEDETKLLIPSLPQEFKRKIARLGIGKAFLFPDSCMVDVPFINTDEIVAFEQHYRDSLTRPTTLQRGRDQQCDPRDPHRDRYDHGIRVRKTSTLSSMRDRFLHARKTGKNPESAQDNVFDHDVHVDHALPRVIQELTSSTQELSPVAMRQLHELRVSIRKKEGKEKAIYRLFGVRKGGKSNNWRILSGVYDKIKQKESTYESGKTTVEE